MESPINVAEVLNRAPLGKFQAWTFLLCFLVEMLDGFDVNTMGFITPPIAADWLSAGDANRCWSRRRCCSGAWNWPPPGQARRISSGRCASY